MVMRAEISYDIVMDNDMEWVEGTFRLPGGEWQIVIVPTFDRDVPTSQVVPHRWGSGVTGVVVSIPRAERIKATSLERILSGVLGVSE